MPFNIRVYGIVLNTADEVLITDEIRAGMKMTKFPGGGLQFGEGSLDALKREFREEMDREITILGHYYTTDFFQESAFDPSQQVLSLYYRVGLPDGTNLPVVSRPFDFSEVPEGEQQVFRWVKRAQLTDDMLTFPIDRHVGGLLRNGWNLSWQ